MSQNQLDPCIFYWDNEYKVFSDMIICRDNNNLLIGNISEFAKYIIEPIKNIYPFKYWKFNKFEFLGGI